MFSDDESYVDVVEINSAVLDVVSKTLNNHFMGLPPAILQDMVRELLVTALTHGLKLQLHDPDTHPEPPPQTVVIFAENNLVVVDVLDHYGAAAATACVDYDAGQIEATTQSWGMVGRSVNTNVLLTRDQVEQLAQGVAAPDDWWNNA